MGIKGISKLIREFSKDITLAELANKKIAIDTSIYLYKFKYNSVGNEFIKKFVYQLISFKKFNIEPIYIFDGKPPIEKQITKDKRKSIKEKAIENAQNENDPEIKKTIEKNIINISPEDISNLKSLFHYTNTKWISCNTEGEKYCSFLNKIGEVDAVMSNDFDSLTFGCENLITSSGDNSLKLYNLTKILTELKISMTDYVDICIASGTDYCPTGIPRIGPVKGLNYVKKYGLIENWEHIILPENLNVDSIKNIRNIFYQDPELITENTCQAYKDFWNLENFLFCLNIKVNQNTILELTN